MKSSSYVKAVACAVAALLLLCSQQPVVQAHQAVNPKILKLVRKAPAGTPSCFDEAGKPTAACIEKGRKLFENGTFGGNGRTCASCHPASNHFTLDVPFINTLPKSDKLFVHEQVEALKDLETPLLRKYGLICENLDGFKDDPTGQSCVLRSVIATEGLKFTTDPDLFANPGTDVTPVRDSDGVITPNPVTPNRPVFPLRGALGWGGDGSPGEGTLREFAIGAVIQHFPKTLLRQPGIDFVLPTDDELDAMEAFQLSLGRQQEMNLSPDPLANNSRFNCTVFDGSAACPNNAVFKLQTIEKLKEWIGQQNKLQGTLITFNDERVGRGQSLFFGGFPSRPDAQGAAKDIRSCSGCHIQAGAGSPVAPNSPKAGNRPRATGASDDPRSPVCLPEAQGIIFNADGGFGQGADGFPEAQAGCNISVATIFFVPTKPGTPIESCFKTFDAATSPPLSNPNIKTASALADVGKKYTVSRRALCGNDSVHDDEVYFKGTTFFSTPSIIEAASTIPLFHNDIVPTVEEAVSFYATEIFNDSVSGAGNRMVLSEEIDIPEDIGAFLRAINALNNLNIAISYIDAAIDAGKTNEKVRNAKLAVIRVADAAAVLTPGGPKTDNYLGIEGGYGLFDANVLSQINAAKDKLTDKGWGALSPAQLKGAHNQIVAACKAMLAPDARAACPAPL